MWFLKKKKNAENQWTVIWSVPSITIQVLPGDCCLVTNHTVNIGCHEKQGAPPWALFPFALSRDLKDLVTGISGPVADQSLSRVQLSATPWAAAHQASQSFTISRSLLRLMSIESVMPSNHLILCRPLLLLPSIFPSIRVFSNESVLCIRWPKYWSFSISPSNEFSELLSLGLTIQYWLSLNHFPWSWT